MVAEPPPGEAHRLALEAFRAGDRDGALVLLHRALAADPDDADIHNSLGVLLGAQGDAEGAIVCFAAAARLAPDDARHFANLGLALRGHGRHEAAIAAFSRAEALDPRSFDVQLHLGLLLRGHGSVAGALRRLHAAVALRPDHPGANMALATALHAAHRQHDALAFYDRVILLRPDLAHAHAARATALQELDRLDDAVAGHRAALALLPDLLEVRCNLAQALRLSGHVAAARHEAGTAVAAHPHSAFAQLCLGLAHLADGDPDGAEAALRRAVGLPALTPDQECALALARLLLGDWPAGWDAYEARFRIPAATPLRVRAPDWDGADLAGRRILLFREQGLGDTIQFLRYVPMVVARGGQVLLWVQPPVAPLLSGWPGVTVLHGAEAELPPFDVQCSLMSLPRVFATRLDTVPAVIPYLVAPPAQPRARSGRLQVGLAWSGRAEHQNDRNRSVGLVALAPLLDVPGVDFHVAQTEIRARDADAMARWPHLIDRHGELHDLADTASLLAGMDLVISVDTAVAHLAGAMGMPVWLLLSATADWRWLLRREDTPWYPQTRLFRQKRVGDWNGVVGQVAEALRRLSETAPASRQEPPAPRRRASPGARG